MLTELMTLPCVIRSRQPTGSSDAHGNPTYDAVVTEAVCELQQDDRREPSAEGTIAVATWTLIAPAGVTITPDDTVEAGGNVFGVRGDPWEARDPTTGAVDHVEATLVLTTGANEASS